MWTILSILVFSILFGIIGGLCYGIPQYRVYSQTKAGEAEFSRAEQNRRVAVEEARAKLDAAVHEADAEIERARGVAEANEIIGESLKNNEAYLRYLWIIGLHDGNGETVYIATEAGLPILEATRRDVAAPAP